MKILIAGDLGVIGAETTRKFVREKTGARRMHEFTMDFQTIAA